MGGCRRLDSDGALLLAQLGVIYIVSLAAVYNITTGTEHLEVWVALLSACAGIIVPSPVLTRTELRPILALPQTEPTVDYDVVDCPEDPTDPARQSALSDAESVVVDSGESVETVERV